MEEKENEFDDVESTAQLVSLINGAKNIVGFTGAGVSTGKRGNRDIHQL